MPRNNDSNDDSDNEPQSGSDEDGTAVEPRPHPGCGERVGEGMILWRRHDAEDVPKLVEVKQCLKDVSDGHFEYVLTDVTHTSEWWYREEDLRDCFWDTGLSNDDGSKPVMDDRIREVYQRVCSHSFHAVHDTDGTPTGEQCIKCRAFREVTGHGDGA